MASRGDQPEIRQSEIASAEMIEAGGDVIAAADFKFESCYQVAERVFAAMMETLEVTPAMLKAGAEVLAWSESEAFDKFYDTYQGSLTSTQVVLQRAFLSMAAASDQTRS